MTGARSLTAVIALLGGVRGLAPLTAGGAAARFSAHGWAPGGRPRNGVETSWDKVLAGFLPEIEGSALAGHLVTAERTAADEDEFIEVAKWTIDGRILTAGVIQQDTDLPVMVVVALEQPGPQV
ncbi:hypothetical protein G3I50_00365 [Streptomyces parvus]|uniref:Uncharacterized protein n=2 Tax=Streptomyces parvus TaxID=66428 RepID=A0A7K3RNB8_9ACTN|nr:hypothetical protein [Streptomyces parvus]NEC16736.1 hypothetical protein [Streptomyces parvus]